MSKLLRKNFAAFCLPFIMLIVQLLPGSAVAQNQITAGESNLAAAIFSDNFNAAGLDANKWRKGTNAGNQAAVVNSAIELRSQGAENGWIITKSAYKARNTIVQIKVAKPNNDGALGISPTVNLASKNGVADQKNWYRFYVYRNGASGPYRLFVQWKKNGVEKGVDVTGSLVINGAVYLRLRFDHKNIYFEASLNGTAWNNAYTEIFALPGYTLDSMFYYELTAYNTATNGTARMDDFSINALPPDTTTPKISLVTSQNITSTGARINWQTNEPADSQVEYGLTKVYGKMSPRDSNLVTTHNFLLAGLQPNTSYHYRVRSRDEAGNLALSGDGVLATPPLPTTDLRVTVPNGDEWWFTEEIENIRWKSALTIANVKIDYSRDGGISWKTLVASAPNSGVYKWQLPDSVSNKNLIRISDAANPNVADLGNKSFYLLRKASVEFPASRTEPVLQGGSPGSWDERITERGWFMYEDGMYHAWYGGWRGDYNREVKNFIKLGYAYSADGVNWTKHPDNPVYTEHWTEDMAIVKNGGTYFMYAENEFTGDGNGATIDLYMSTDKVNWTRHGVVLTPSTGWEANDVGTPTVWKEGNKWFMLYEGFDNGAGKVGLATSADGKSWTRFAGNPVLLNFLNPDLDIAIDSVIKIRNVYYAYGHYDSSAGVWAGGLFTSTDLIKWSAYPGNPILDNSAVVVDNGVNYLMYGISSNPDALAPYYLKFSTHTKDMIPPKITGVAAKVLNGISAKFDWLTNEPADTRIEYGLTTSYGALSPLDSAFTAVHTLTLNGLQGNKTYHFRVRSRDEFGNLAMSKDSTFKTPDWIFTDNFNSNTLGTSRWRLGTNANNKSAVVDSALEFRSLAVTSGGNESGWVITRTPYPARYSRVRIKVVKPNSDGALGMTPAYNLASKYGITDQLNFYRFYNFRNGNTGPYRLIVQSKKNGVEDERDVTGALVITGAFFMRLRFDKTNIHFEASLDGVKWTDAYTEAFSLPGYTLDSPFYYELAAYSTPTTGVWRVDDFGIFTEPHVAAKSTAEESVAATLPEKFALNNYPNPFNAATRLQLALPREAEVELAIFDLTGREVQQLLLGSRSAGHHEIIWNGRDRRGAELGTGIYLARLRYRIMASENWSQLVHRVMMVK